MDPKEAYFIDVIEKMEKQLRRQIGVGVEEGHTITKQKYDRLQALQWALEKLKS